jgi:hypothetical protein
MVKRYTSRGPIKKIDLSTEPIKLYNQRLAEMGKAEDYQAICSLSGAVLIIPKRMASIVLEMKKRESQSGLLRQIALSPENPQHRKILEKIRYVPPMSYPSARNVPATKLAGKSGNGSSYRGRSGLVN